MVATSPTHFSGVIPAHWLHQAQSLGTLYKSHYDASGSYTVVVIDPRAQDAQLLIDQHHDPHTGASLSVVDRRRFPLVLLFPRQQVAELVPELALPMRHKTPPDEAMVVVIAMARNYVVSVPFCREPAL